MNLCTNVEKPVKDIMNRYLVGGYGKKIWKFDVRNK